MLPTVDGGFLIADTCNGRVRRVGPDGLISTVAGTDKSDIYDSFGDGGPATAAGLALPQHLARLPDGSLLIGEQQRIRQVSPDGTISTIFQVPELSATRLGDFAGRYGDTIEAMDVTEEGGIAVILVVPCCGRLPGSAPDPTHARGTPRRARVAAARQGDRRRDKARHPAAAGPAPRQAGCGRHPPRRAGRQVIAVSRRFARAYHDVRVTLRARRGGSHCDHSACSRAGRCPSGS